MEFNDLNLDGPIELVPHKVKDKRGYFSEIFRLSDFVDKVGAVEFVQDNQSLSVLAGTVRGIHFQTSPRAQGKLVRCIAGRVFDVAVDLRHDSPHYGAWTAVTLTPCKNNHLWIPVGFGHAFCTLEPNSVIHYRVTDYYSLQHDRGLAWDDPDVAIDWPRLADADTLSAKDRDQPPLAELPRHFSMKG